MKHRGGSVRQGIPRGRKSQSCEDVSTRGRSAVSQSVVDSDHGSESISTSRDSNVHPTVLSQPDSGTSTASQPVTVRESSSCHDCPVEVQTHQLLDAQEKERRIRRMYTEFKAKRKVVLSGLPPSCNTEVQLPSYKLLSTHLQSLVPRPNFAYTSCGLITNKVWTTFTEETGA